MRELRIDIVSDTHGLLTDELKRELRGADHIVHAGDICSTADYQMLRTIAPLHACLGNNDYAGQYGPGVERLVTFNIDGVRFQVCHHKERLKPAGADVCVYGHTHRPSIERADVGGKRGRRAGRSIAARLGVSDFGATPSQPYDETPLDEPVGALLINPGSPSAPRTSLGPTIGRLWIRDGVVENPQIVQLPLSEAQQASPWFMSF
ncbi:metallophosphoesterase family protein [Olsenella sp. YH-ols2217]|uniref:Metallophosphoesterase family protein n=1 Tax=Kribbibacterium absianum TaxID=3044210 RepID=A0ABT6ZJ79_9ACTN|nr:MULTISPECIES: metallophosphoesterase family protein [unclassified Olsenella]MDJ1122670.1 metallophosphoesterase family protein [Olsenella sp. YH-ols2216]MDJ1129108.1 metallophosphoesterase family protein [Olsenella sp. YH-ols2217]